MHDLALAEEFEGLADVGVVDHADQVVVGHARLLLRCNRLWATVCSKIPKHVNTALLLLKNPQVVNSNLLFAQKSPSR